jgi:CubicO group peptidase (beta-lactamase class C family)
MFNHLHPAQTALSSLVALSFVSIPVLLSLAREDPKLQNRTLRPGKPDEAGMSATRLDQASQILDEETASGRVLAASILVARHGSVVLQRGFGRVSPDSAAPPAKADTIYFLASITKPFTAAALMLLAERGLVGLTDPAQKYLPEFQGPERERVRVQDLLSHTSGLPDMLPENLQLRRDHAPLSEFVKHAMTTPLLYTPRTAFGYQSMGTLLAAAIVERLSHSALRDFEKKEFFDPLGMKDSALGLGGRSIGDTAWCQGRPTYAQNEEDQKLFGPNSCYWRDLGHPWGGMHSSAVDLGVFLQMFLNGGTYAGRRILSLASVEAMTSDQNHGVNAPWGLGWGLKQSRIYNYFGDLSSDRTFGHVGATGTVAWADLNRDVLCVILTTRPIDEDSGFLLRRVSNMVASAVEQ